MLFSFISQRGTFTQMERVLQKKGKAGLPDNGIGLPDVEGPGRGKSRAGPIN
jgi:hypothetical protein